MPITVTMSSTSPLDTTSARIQSTPTAGSNTTETQTAPNTVTADSGDQVTLSSAAIDLSRAVASLAATSSMSRSALLARLQDIPDELGRLTDREVALADKEVPNSSDPARLARAKAATAAIYRQGPNPFANLSRADLSAIVYDNSGAYTQNERNAALIQQTELDNQFWGPLAAAAQASGDWRAQNTAMLAFYEQLSPLEKSAYPVNFEENVRAHLSEQNSKHGGPLSKTLLDELGKKYTEMRNESSGGSGDGNDQDSKSWSNVLKTLGLAAK